MDRTHGRPHGARKGIVGSVEDLKLAQSTQESVTTLQRAVDDAPGDPALHPTRDARAHRMLVGRKRHM